MVTIFTRWEKESILVPMNRHVQDSRVFLKHTLGAIAMVDIPIKDQNSENGAKGYLRYLRYFSRAEVYFAINNVTRYISRASMKAEVSRVVSN
jgi:hypothetical protein